MIPLPGIRDKGAGPHLGARRDGELGPYGIRGQDDEEHLDEDDAQEHDDHRASVRRADGTAADTPSAANDTEGEAP